VQPLTSDDPAMVGSYRLRARLGAGGMGRVYLASTPAGRPVALKVVRAEIGEDPEFRTRFRREIQAAQRVHGLYTAQLVDADPDATPPWLVTAYVPGPSLEEAVEQHGPMPEAMVLRLIAGVAEALQVIHAADVVHRDLKPSNVLLAEDGPRVIDFGIAQARGATSLTRSNIMMGSPDFLVPEQVLDLPITPAIDVFALGALAVYAATGRPPFAGGSLMAVVHRVAYEPPDLTDCPPQLLTLIESCLEKHPKDRPSLSQIIEFCVTRAAGTSESGQSWLAWGQTGAGTDSAALAMAQALGSGGSGGSGGRSGKAERSRLRRAVGLAVAVALVAVAITAVAFTSHLAASSAASSKASASSTAAARHSASTAPQSTVAAASPSVTRATSPAPSHATSPAASHATSPAASRSATHSVAASPSPTESAIQEKPVILLSQDHPVFSSSIQGNTWAAANAVDGNLTTRWSSAFSDPQWLEVDLGAVYDIHSVVLYWENAYATAFQIQVSDNGSTWTDLYPTISGYVGKQTLPVSGSGRYVRMYGTKRVTQYGYSLYEFQVFGN
jgi:eukaryotic-like serine/threonine-protein kinase